MRKGECVCPNCAKREIAELTAKLGSMEKAAAAMGTSRSQLQLSAARSEVSRTFWKAAQRKVPAARRRLRTMSGGKP
jgi:uncharacterized Zn finger protein (UPF0148 family)